MNHPASRQGNGALITGGASGIGLAVAELLVRKGLMVCLADKDEEALRIVLMQLNEIHKDSAIGRVTDVSDGQDMQQLKAFVDDGLPNLSFLMNNAGVGGGGGAYSSPEGWQKVLGVNLWGVINGLQTFVTDMIAAKRPAIIVNTGSKQGITNPPGDAAYNVSKAGVRSVTEQLAHELRNTDNCEISAHLLVPGFTYTGMIKRFADSKPAAAWEPHQVAARLFAMIDAGDFYILCPDNDVSTEVDNARIQWNTDDLILNRPALSRWHPDFADEFEQHMKAYD